MKPFYKTMWVLCFAVAMGFLETSVVVFLRALYYPEGFQFPLKMMAQNLVVTELYREAATLVMIISVSVLASKYRLHRFAWFLAVFGIWDIMYYVFLKMLLGWPESLLTTDILFLLPGMWTGPVIAPVINSLTMILMAVVILNSRKGSRPTLRLTGGTWALLIIGSLLVLTAYMEDFTCFVLEYQHSLPAGGEGTGRKLIELSSRFVPRSFDWLLFGMGVCLHVGAIYMIIKRKLKG
jgi:hypothetical protein